MNALGCLLTLFVGVLLLAMGVLVALWRFLTGPLLRRNAPQNNMHAGPLRHTKPTDGAMKQGKVIGDDEGEYVDFEEIADEDEASEKPRDDEKDNP